MVHEDPGNDLIGVFRIVQYLANPIRSCIFRQLQADTQLRQGKSWCSLGLRHARWHDIAGRHTTFRFGNCTLRISRETFRPSLASDMSFFASIRAVPVMGGT